MKKLIALFMVAMLAVCCFTVNTFAIAEGSIDFQKHSNAVFTYGTTEVWIYPDEDPLTFSPISAYAEVCYDSSIDDFDYSSSDGSYAVSANASGDLYPNIDAGHINQGNSRYWQAS